MKPWRQHLPFHEETKQNILTIIKSEAKEEKHQVLGIHVKT